MGKQANGHDDNVILFPGLVARLVEKGMSSLKEKKLYDALTYFKQSTDLEPQHPQARYGLVITNIELNRLNEAKKYCESMLKEGIGEYFDVLQVYVSLLIQLGDYEEVVGLLETVMTEEKLPAKMAESFYHLLDFARNMTEGFEEIADEVDFGEKDSLEMVPSTDELIKVLEKGHPDQQWGAIQQLSHYDSSEVQNAYRAFLKDKDHSPVLKSYLLQILREMKHQGVYEVHKFNEQYQVNIEDLEDVFHEKFGNEVIHRLEHELGQENPSLFEMVGQVWWHYLFAIYPQAPIPLDIEVWACALHHMGNSLMEEETSYIEDVLPFYGSEKEATVTAVKQMKEIESLLFATDQTHT
ncbi:hypothetical protein CR203_17985 [Salipaludibacillus neizhouensis]|uniref:Uncharacterized protein n=1 Tax=Salipaludibacillus neizhouensis TaxID=885475 RepID=A0A3A9K653_9BACI|nr:tetratricopeptide repeat protein [Salipaludibacillus neizhouensis]RKL65962.1 hypothetical protein CR203_17985 [Salipaludibacillus neizhouensis]